MSIIEQKESLSFMPTDSIALNEIESNGVLYVRAKPSPEAIRQLRAIKKQRFNDKIETADKVTETLLTTDLKDLGTTRGENRAVIEKRITEKILTFFKNSQGFTKSDLNNLFSDVKAERTKRQLTQKILKNMQLMGKVKKTLTKAKVKQLQNRPLMTDDKGSYQLMMKANGYNYDAENESYKPSRIPHDKQGVYSNSNMSVISYDIPYDKTIYELI